MLGLYYGDAPRATRLFLRIRLLLSDMERIEREVPPSGVILELGCGHGLFSNLMALRSPGRRVIGIDLSPEKVRHARASIGGRANIEFRDGDMLALELPGCDAIAIVDVTYLLPREEQLRLLKECRRRLKPGGVLVWKAQERRPRWKFAVTWLQEALATSAGLTQGRRRGLHFPSRAEAVAMLAAAGFSARVVEMPTRRPYTDIIYVGVTSSVAATGELSAIRPGSA